MLLEGIKNELKIENIICSDFNKWYENI